MTPPPETYYSRFSHTMRWRRREDSSCPGSSLFSLPRSGPTFLWSVRPLSPLFGMDISVLEDTVFNPWVCSSVPFISA